jgi:periplasmic divalent cation tolerance protein
MGEERPEIAILLSTCPPDEAARLAAFLIEGRHAACVNIVPGVESVYRWQGQIERSAESLLIVKCAATRVAEVTAALLEEHPYDLPEVVALPVAGGSEAYRRWVLENARG